MPTPNHFAPLLALAAHIEKQHEHPVKSMVNLERYQTYRNIACSNEASASTHLVSMNSAALLLANAEGEPAATLFRLAACSVEQGLRGLAIGLGYPEMQQARLLLEIGQLVVKGIFPHPLACFAQGGVGSMTVHHLPLAHYKGDLHIANKDIATQAALFTALRQARTRHAINERMSAPIAPGHSPTNWTVEQWQTLTWKLGYTSVFTLILLAPQRAPLDSRPAPAELHAALNTIVSYCQQVFTAYLAPQLAYSVVGEAFAVSPTQLAA